ncbi:MULTISPECIES: hypothetical protein [Enterobacter]|uniref:hypothetical protein n=1 Tax=Enterobacter TaxID=547 RepID=UPI00084F8897|nr:MULTISPECIES: hypothetical protein [Enterobacter]MBW7681278.1 hypothetical protein [Enterobacter roggenkampii]MCU3854674.1 hypothetical protein [Enterobacter roggenkampii]OEI70688.1 hypothetical protein BFG58_17815 [Enterobacter sp. ku-bf2]WJS51135.1 hypothetical protein QU521_00300 [Enterobacter roggenkampii]
MVGVYAAAVLQGKEPLAPTIGAGIGTAGGVLTGKGYEKVQEMLPQYVIPKFTGTVLESLSYEYFGSKGQATIEAIQKNLARINN